MLREKRFTDSSYRGRRAGFTLLELLIVMMVVGALAGIVLVTYPASQRRARDTQRKSEVKQYHTALEAYANRSNNFYPAGADGNMVAQCGTLRLAACPDDPQGLNPYRYQSNVGGTLYVVWARLEQKDDAGSVQFFVSCSTGVSGETKFGIPPAGGSCPI